MRILTCLATMHDPWLLCLAALLCAVGSAVTASIHARFRAADRKGVWLCLAALTSGATVWCTHFVAMLAFDPGGGATFEFALTALSLVLAVTGSAAAFSAAAFFPRWQALSGGAILGLTVSGMHYVGMSAYASQGIVGWDMGYVVASVTVSVAFAILAMKLIASGSKAWSAASYLVAVVGLHFTGMAALLFDPSLSAGVADGTSTSTFALSIAVIATAILGAASAAGLIDARAAVDAARGMERLAMTDMLTGLPNRAAFASALEEAIAAADRSGGSLAVFGIDLDHFKEINDLRGHTAGDAALRAVAERMRAVLVEGEYIARLGGDEFAAFKRVGDGSDEARELAERLRSAILPPIRLPDGSEAAVDGCFGVALYPEDGTTAEALIGNADLAMYRAKATSGVQFVHYQPEMDEAVRSRRKLVGDLRLALAGNQFELHYQVQESLVSKAVTGYEALLRWNHPERGLVPPLSFIPAAEDTGMIVPIGEWVLRRACADAAARPEMMRVAVNMSAAQFSHPDLPGLISSVLEETGLDPSRLEIELTESTLMADPAGTLETLSRIQALGVSIAMDDFGTGYSSLSTLRSFHFDKIKLDRSFMSEVETDAQAKAIIRAVLALGRSLRIPVLAEGVETDDQMEFLRAEGCDEAQGYLLGRPSRLGPQAVTEMAA